MSKHILLAIAICLSLSFNAAAFGPEWVEEESESGDDGGGGPGSSQPTIGDGPLDRISGTLTLDLGRGTSGELDLEDVYLICIEDPTQFSATTQAILGQSGASGAFAEFDSQLYLFEAAGLGLLGNQSTGQLDDLGFDFARLPAQADDGTGQIIPGPGNYLLAITSFGQPTGGGGPIFKFSSPTEVSGPDGSGAEEPLEQFDPEATGACCIEGECLILTAAECASLLGTYFGDGSFCADRFNHSDDPFEDISDIGIPVPFSDGRAHDDDEDDAGAHVSIGFAFTHYGNTYSDVAVSTNGYLTFSSDPDDWDEPFGQLFPNHDDPNDVIAPLWNDFQVDIDDGLTGSGTVHYLTLEDRFIVQWTDVKQDYGFGSRRATFQVVLYEGSNCIEFRYQRLDHWLALLFTVIGIENADGTDGFNVHPFSIDEGDAIRYCPGGIDCSEARGSGPTGPLEYRIVLTGACFATEDPLGTCVLPNETCVLQIQSQCELAGGVWTTGGVGDNDEDSIANGCDNCPDTFNPDQTDTDDDGIGDACELPCPADIIDSGKDNLPDSTVDMFDLMELLMNWNSDGPGAEIAEPIDIVDVFDLVALLDSWGPCP